MYISSLRNQQQQDRDVSFIFALCKDDMYEEVKLKEEYTSKISFSKKEGTSRARFAGHRYRYFKNSRCD